MVRTHPLPPSFAARCRALKWLSLLAAAALALATLGLPLLFASLGGGDGWAAFVQALPVLCYLHALWTIARAFAALERGRLLLPVLAATFTRVGIALAAGAATSVFLVFNVLRAMGSTQGGYLHYDAPAIVLGVVGLALLPLADLLRRAHAIEAELDDFL